ncbi:amidohydrolase [Bacillus coahuilensis p1.1.43]|uniref:Amidohydrolase n=2 Tax=Bacillus coahuilensis TaxID=408580 RepID=A0A147K8C7_9BACI|nr:amidohydrolase [Bacillus coahuilensis p1.1.43]
MILLKNGTVHTVTNGTFSKIDVLLYKKKIIRIGNITEIPPGCEIFDCTDLHILPGLIDAHTHLGLYDEGTGWAGNDANESIEPLTPHIRALDGVYPLDTAFSDAIRYGVTTVNIMPGSSNVIGGITSVIKTYGKKIDDMIIKKESGLKIALGENPKRIHSNGRNDSITRMGIMGMLREAFFDVKTKQSDDFRSLAIRKALNQEIPVRIHAHRADDIISALRFADEFQLDVRIEHCTEGHLITEYLRERNLKVTVGPTLTRRSKVELKNKSWSTYTHLTNAGVEVSITTDHPYTPIQYLHICASIAVREGLTPQKALEGITILPAINLGVSHRVGSIELGKDADLVVWNEHPFHYLSKPLYTFINGECVSRNM